MGAAPEPVQRLPSGVGAVDALLGGGVPRGRISELIGPLSSGKTSFLLTLLAAATRRGELVACVDIADALHPASLAAAGADLGRVLWVRPHSPVEAARCTALLLQAGGFTVVALDLGTPVPRPLRAQLWPRLLHAAEQSQTAAIILAPQRVAGSFATLSLGVQRRAFLWHPGVWSLWHGFDTTVQLLRNKLGAPGRATLLQARAAEMLPITALARRAPETA